MLNIIHLACVWAGAILTAAGVITGMPIQKREIAEAATTAATKAVAKALGEAAK